SRQEGKGRTADRRSEVSTPHLKRRHPPPSPGLSGSLPSCLARKQQRVRRASSERDPRIVSLTALSLPGTQSGERNYSRVPLLETRHTLCCFRARQRGEGAGEARRGSRSASV